jgi:hypothetical protein
MMFKKALLEKVLSGEKTQTRRSTQRKPGVRVYEVGEIVGIRAGYTKYTAYIRITGKRKDKIGNITEDDARKEGFASIEDFKQTWVRIAGKWTPGLIVWVYDFVLVQSSDLSSKGNNAALAASLSTFL